MKINLHLGNMAFSCSNNLPGLARPGRGTGSPRRWRAISTLGWRTSGGRCRSRTRRQGPAGEMTAIENVGKWAFHILRNANNFISHRSCFSRHARRTFEEQTQRKPIEECVVKPSVFFLSLTWKKYLSLYLDRTRPRFLASSMSLGNLTCSASELEIKLN